MKKFLLSMVAAATTLVISAETATFDFSKPEDFGYPARSEKSNTGVDYSTAMVQGDVTLTCDTKTAKTGGGMLRFWYPSNASTASDFRCSATGGALNQTLTFSVTDANITKIEFTAAKFALTAAPGTLDDYDSSTKTAVWTGEASEVVFTTTDANTFNKIVVTYEAADPNKESAELAYSPASVTLRADEIDSFEAPVLSNPHNVAVSYESSDENVAEVDATGKVTLNGDEGTATITASFAGDDTYRAGSASYTITVKAALAHPTSVAETIALANKTDFAVDYELTVGFVNAKNIFACDANGDFIQVYGENSYKTGDKIPAGWEGTYELYSSTTPEIMPISTLPAGTEGSFLPKAVAVEDITTALVNNVIMIKNVVIAEATPGADVTDTNAKNFTAKVGDTDITLRNNYKLESVAAGTYDVTVVVTIFSNAPSLYVVKFEAPGAAGIEDITVDAAAPAEYYNLQGVRIANPKAGNIYIVRQGGKTSKVAF